MDHLVQFTISIDDKHIAQVVEQKAAKAMEDEVLKICRKYIYDDRDNYWAQDRLGEPIKKEIRAFFDANKDAIIDEASKKLAEKMMRTKVIKEALAESVIKETL